MRPSVALHMKRSEIREAVGRFRAANPRVFGSVLYGSDRDGSDLDAVWETIHAWLPELLKRLAVVRPSAD